MRCSKPHACLICKLRTVLSPDEWRQFCVFSRSLKDRFDGSNGFEQLTYDELAELSAWATRAREEGR